MSCRTNNVLTIDIVHAAVFSCYNIYSASGFDSSVSSESPDVSVSFAG